jgi:hypothetical protein
VRARLVENIGKRYVIGDLEARREGVHSCGDAVVVLVVGKESD